MVGEVDTTIETICEGINGANLRGLLVASGEVWFPYSIEAVKLLREGLMLAVKNTSSVHLHNISGSDEDQHFSLLRIDQVDTRHFVIDSVRDARSDVPVSIEGLLNKQLKEWQRKAADPEENNLRIIVSVSPTGLEVDLPMAASSLRGYQFRVGDQTGSTMLGEVAYLMKSEVARHVVNRGMAGPAANPTTIVAGSHTLYRDPSLDVFMDADSLFRRHFGLFGFTGAGKTNLLSTLLSRCFSAGESTNDEWNANVLLFDVNNEFFSLLIDVLVQVDAHIVFLDHEIGFSMARFLDGDFSARDAAAQEFLTTTTRSSRIRRLFGADTEFRENLTLIIQLMLSAGRFKRYVSTPEPLALGFLMAEILVYGESLKARLKGAGQAKKRQAWDELLNSLSGLFDDLSHRATLEDLARLVAHLAFARSYCASDTDDEENPFTEIFAATIPKNGKDRLYSDLVAIIDLLAEEVARIVKGLDTPIAVRGHAIDLSGLHGVLHDDRRTLVIFLGHENSLRLFSEQLGQFVYDSRRRSGIIEPASVFVFDEADIFIPGASAPVGDDEKEAVKASKRIATTLARRGRKYGLGLGIATQRITYLETSILAQIGTYFVGKLPRLTDRQRITEGFGIDHDNLQSGIGRVGEWVVLSHTSVGDKGSAIPVYFPDADERIADFVGNFAIANHPEFARMVRTRDPVTDLQDSDILFGPVMDLNFLP